MARQLKQEFFLMFEERFLFFIPMGMLKVYEVYRIKIYKR